MIRQRTNNAFGYNNPAKSAKTWWMWLSLVLVLVWAMVASAEQPLNAATTDPETTNPETTDPEITAPQTTDSAAAQLGQRLAPLQQLQGRFVQNQYDSDGTLLTESHGTYIMQRPGHFRWVTEAPFPQELIANGETIWLYDPDLETVTVRQFDPQLQQTPAVILSGDISSLKEQYTIHKAQRSTTKGASETFTLQPKQTQSLFQSLQLEFANEQLVAITVIDGLRQKTRFALSAENIVDSVTDDLFHFTPPEGADVIIDG